MLSGSVRRAASSLAAVAARRGGGPTGAAPAVAGGSRGYRVGFGGGRSSPPRTTEGAPGAVSPQFDERFDDDDGAPTRGGRRTTAPPSTLASWRLRRYRAAAATNAAVEEAPRLAALRLHRRAYHATPSSGMPRRDSPKKFYAPRVPTKKQRKKRVRRLRAAYHEKVGKHGRPGSKAGERREEQQEWWDEMVRRGRNAELGIKEEVPPELMEYGMADAIRDDLMGNTADLTSSEDPEPNWIGYRWEEQRRRVAGTMRGWNEHVLALESGQGQVNGAAGLNGALVEVPPRLPTDDEISVLVRSYRDKHSKPNQAVGLARALKLLLSGEVGPGELPKIPMSAWGEKTYTALVSCCATPAEGRRALRMLEDALAKSDQTDGLFSDPMKARTYAHSILVHLHSRAADFRGAAEALDNMSREGVQPTLPAYTSLLSACYKVCNSSSAPVAIKAEAGKVGWDRWKEMRVVGLEPDVMAYGAMLRVLGARGQPERAINVLEEMQIAGVKPTTLCFSAALRSVSRSHASALRFSSGRSKRNKSRESIAAHHGRMCRDIVIKAESAEVRQDDGFVAALMGCAGVAGDSATVKAIYLASEVRRMTELRRIGGEDHMAMLRGEAPPALRGGEEEGAGGGSQSLLGSGEALRGLLPGLGENSEALAEIASGLVQQSRQDAKEGRESELPAALAEQLASEMQQLQSETNGLSAVNGDRKKLSRRERQERLHGPDTRRMVALLSSYASAAEPAGLGELWSRDYEPTGRNTNRGYLDEFTLHLLPQRPKPRMVDNTFPGMTSWDVGQGAMTWDEEKEQVEGMSKRLRRAKFRGVEMDPDAGNTIDDVDPLIADMWRYDPLNNSREIDPFTGEPLDKNKHEGGGKKRWILPGPNEDEATLNLMPPGVSEKEAREQIDALETDTVQTVAGGAPDDEEAWENPDDDDGEEWEEENDDDGGWDDDEAAAYSATAAPAGESLSGGVGAGSKAAAKSAGSAPPPQEKEEGDLEYYFDAKRGKWKTRAKGGSAARPVETVTPEVMPDEGGAAHDGTGKASEAKAFPSGGMFEVSGPAVVDPSIDLSSLPPDQKVLVDDLLSSMPELESDHFESFRRQLREEMAEGGEDPDDVDEQEARELFELMKEERRRGEEMRARAKAQAKAWDGQGAEEEGAATTERKKIVDESDVTEEEIFRSLRGGMDDREYRDFEGGGADNKKDARDWDDDEEDAQVAAWEKVLRELKEEEDGDEGEGSAEEEDVHYDDDEDEHDPFDDMDPDEFQALIDAADGKTGRGRGGGGVDVEKLLGMMGSGRGIGGDGGKGAKATGSGGTPSRTEMRSGANGEEPDEEPDFETLMDMLDPKRKKKGDESTGGGGGGVNAGDNDDDDLDARAERLARDLGLGDGGDGGAKKPRPLLREEEEGRAGRGGSAATRVLDRPVAADATGGEMVEAADEFVHKETSPAALSFSDDGPSPATSPSSAAAKEGPSDAHPTKDFVTLRLEEALPGLPPHRIKRLRSLFLGTLGDPSMLRLVPALRENMPPTAGPGWLKRKNLRDARYAMQTAEDEGRVDLPTLNAMLRVETTCGGLDRAAAFHEREFAEHGLRPTPYSDRLVLDMLVKNRRLSRALAFKHKVESDGRTLDLLSYGTLIEYLGRRGQLGSALLLLRECIAVHGSPPGEKALKNIRSVCRRRGLEKELGLTDMIGEDPLEWIWDGKVNRKKEKSYRGRREINLPENRALQI